MSSFKDINGRDWSIFVSAGTIRRVRDAIGFDLQKLMGPSNEWSEIDEDAVKLGEVLAEVLRPEIDRLAVPVPTFLEALSGDAIHNAREALLDAVEACAPPMKRAAMKDFRVKYREFMASAYARQAATLATAATEAMAKVEGEGTEA